MPRVEKDAEVTLVVLVYRSLRWLSWCMEGVDQSKNETRYRWLVVSNDGTPEVEADPRVSLAWRNDDPKDFYINSVYRAWNAGVIEAPTQLVVMLNSDMFASDYWLDALVAIKENRKISGKHCVPTSLLVESGRIPSAMPEFVHDFGRNPDEFRPSEFLLHANGIRVPGRAEPGRLYMPILVDRQEFMDVGMYPEGNPSGTTGDKDLIRRYHEKGFEHLTAIGSVVYHVQCGEQEWP